MAKQTSVNLTPATGSVAMFDLMEFLRVDLGFTIARSGDGLSAFDDTGVDVFTAGGVSGANGMANTDAWFVARDPGGEYEWCFQRASSNIAWEIVPSALDGFTGGSAAVRATATDEQVIHDGTIFSADGTYIWHLVGFDIAEVGIYPWLAYATEVATGDPETIIGHESLDPASYPALVGTRAAPTTGEPDPSLYIAGFSASSFPFLFTTSAGGWHASTSSVDAWYAMNGTNGKIEAFVSYNGADYGVSTDELAPADAGAGDGIGADPRDDTDPMLPILMGRPRVRASQVGHKGFTAHIRVKGVDREYPDVLDLSGERFVYAGDLLLPFENGTVPGV